MPMTRSRCWTFGAYDCRCRGVRVSGHGARAHVRAHVRARVQDHMDRVHVRRHRAAAGRAVRWAGRTYRRSCSRASTATLRTSCGVLPLDCSVCGWCARSLAGAVRPLMRSSPATDSGCATSLWRWQLISGGARGLVYATSTRRQRTPSSSASSCPTTPRRCLRRRGTCCRSCSSTRRSRRCCNLTAFGCYLMSTWARSFALCVLCVACVL